MKIKFEEETMLQNIIKSNYVDKNNITNTIYDLAKYYYHVKKLNDDDAYKVIVAYIEKNCPSIVEAGIYKDVQGCIKDVKKSCIQAVDKVPITKSELDFICNLGDIKEEKAAFVMLAVAKYYNVVKNFDYDSAFLTHSDICKMARITIDSKERDKFMQFAYDKDVLSRSTESGSNRRHVRFVSHLEEDKVVLELRKGDYDDLAYAYLAYKSPKKYRRCIKCGRWIRKDKNNHCVCIECEKKDNIVGTESKDTRQTKKCSKCGATYYSKIRDITSYLCEECNRKAHNELAKAAYEPVGNKIVTCVDCGKEFEVDSRNTKKIRCDECQKEYRKKWDRERKSK